MGERLDSWKEIAQYLGREVRTVQRWSLTRGFPLHHLPGGSRPRVFALRSEIDVWLQGETRASQEEAASVAVLPFVSLAGGKEDQYFGDGLAEDIINALVRVPGLRVTARTSSFAFSPRGQDVRRIGAHLGVAWLLEGKVDHGLREARRVYRQINKPLVAGAMALIYGLFLGSEGRKQAERLLSELKEVSRTAYVPPAAFAWAYLGLRDDRVFEWLDRAIDARGPVATHLPSMSLYDGIREDPHFQGLLAKMNLS